MKGWRWAGLILVAAVGLLGVSLHRAKLAAGQSPSIIRWQITGQASGKAQDDSLIVFQGNGTFALERREEVAGGGTWTIRSASGEIKESGTYAVTELLSWHEAPSSASGSDRAGLAFLRIRYSNGNEGVLVVSCHLAGTPDSVFEGIIASMGFVGFWNRETGTTLFGIAGE